MFSKVMHKRQEHKLILFVERKLAHQLSTHAKTTSHTHTLSQGFHKPGPREKVAIKATPRARTPTITPPSCPPTQVQSHRRLQRKTGPDPPPRKCHLTLLSPSFFSQTFPIPSRPLLLPPPPLPQHSPRPPFPLQPLHRPPPLSPPLHTPSPAPSPSTLSQACVKGGKA